MGWDPASDRPLLLSRLKMRYTGIKSNSVNFDAREPLPTPLSTNFFVSEICTVSWTKCSLSRLWAKK